MTEAGSPSPLWNLATMRSPQPPSLVAQRSLRRTRAKTPTSTPTATRPPTAPRTSLVVAPPWVSSANTPMTGRIRVTIRFHTLVTPMADEATAGPNP